jgi:hypothetical protein
MNATAFVHFFVYACPIQYMILNIGYQAKPNSKYHHMRIPNQAVAIYRFIKNDYANRPSTTITNLRPTLVHFLHSRIDSLLSLNRSQNADRASFLPSYMELLQYI